MIKKMYDEATRQRWQRATHEAIKDGEDHARRIWRIVSRVRLRYGALLGKFLEEREELRATKPALWMARAKRASLEKVAASGWEAYHAKHPKSTIGMKHWYSSWWKAEAKCLKKAKE